MDQADDSGGRRRASGGAGPDEGLTPTERLERLRDGLSRGRSGRSARTEPSRADPAARRPDGGARRDDRRTLGDALGGDASQRAGAQRADQTRSSRPDRGGGRDRLILDGGRRASPTRGVDIDDEAEFGADPTVDGAGPSDPRSSDATEAGAEPMASDTLGLIEVDAEPAGEPDRPAPRATATWRAGTGPRASGRSAAARRDPFADPIPRVVDDAPSAPETPADQASQAEASEDQTSGDQEFLGRDRSVDVAAPDDFGGDDFGGHETGASDGAAQTLNAPPALDPAPRFDDVAPSPPPSGAVLVEDGERDRADARRDAADDDAFDRSLDALAAAAPSSRGFDDAFADDPFEIGSVDARSRSAERRGFGGADPTVVHPAPTPTPERENPRASAAPTPPIDVAADPWADEDRADDEFWGAKPSRRAEPTRRGALTKIEQPEPAGDDAEAEKTARAEDAPVGGALVAVDLTASDPVEAAWFRGADDPRAKGFNEAAREVEARRALKSSGAGAFARVERLLSGRYLRARRKEGFISVIAALSLAGIALGVAILIIVMSVMNGFRAELVSKIVGVNGHLTVMSLSSEFTDFREIAERVRAVPGVTRAAPLVEAQAFASAPRAGVGVVVRGVTKEDLLTLEKVAVTPEDAYGSLSQFEGEQGIAVGQRLAARLGLTVGDSLTLISPRGAATPFGVVPRKKSYPIVYVFKVGMSSYDESVVFMPLFEAQKFFNKNGGVDAIEVMVATPERLTGYREDIEVAAGRPILIGDWQENNRSLIGALKTERTVMFLILSFLILIASLIIIAGMIMLVKEKGRDIAILRTMGLSRGAVMRVFFMCGASIGLVGTMIGVCLGLVFCANIEQIADFVSYLANGDVFPADIYFLSKLPAQVHMEDVVMTVGISLGLSFLATLYPAWRAARLDPVEALRYE